MPRRVLQGQVVSDRSDKTVIVSVESRVKHPIYKKYIRVSKKYAAHDEGNTKNLGEIVRIVETSPISKKKRWAVLTSEKIEGLVK